MTEQADRLFHDHLSVVRSRMDQALAAGGFDGALIPSGLPPMLFDDDQPYPFKANPQFKLWVPEAAPACHVLYRPGASRPTLVFHQPVDYWHKPPALPSAAWVGEFDVVIVRAPEEVRGAVEPGLRWALLGPADPAWEGLGTPNPPELVTRLAYSRAAKTPYEVDCMARANRLGVQAHRAAEAAFRAGASEYEIHLAYCRAASLREEELPYNNIIALGDHGAVLHYQHLGRSRPAGATSFLIDAGATWAGYASDITRTYAADRGPFAELVAALDGAQQRLAGQVVAGRDYRELHLEAHREIGVLLVEHGLVRATAEAAVESGATSVFFPHGIGHLLGLQVHDVGGLLADERGTERPRPGGHPYLRLTRKLEPGFVVTVEPGIYFIEPLLAAAAAGPLRALIDWPAVDALRPCGGIRIEDNVVALDGTSRNLTREAFAAAG